MTGSRWTGRYITAYFCNNVKVYCVYEDITNQQLVILFYNPLLPESDYLDLIDVISKVESVGTCAGEHRSKPDCNVNFWYFESAETIKTIGDILDVFFGRQKEKNNV